MNKSAKLIQNSLKLFFQIIDNFILIEDYFKYSLCVYFTRVTVMEADIEDKKYKNLEKKIIEFDIKF